MTRKTDVEAKIDRSSFGTRGAKQLRARTPPNVTKDIEQQIKSARDSLTENTHTVSDAALDRPAKHPKGTP